ncbi:MAG: hypothetical protein HGA45_15095 [Chloroflexales bacterium]|nr:hypothetical protein [Chloroflexales bacterium]
MQRLTQTISKMFVILVLLFGSPPPVSLRQIRWRPVVTLVATAPRRHTDDLQGLAGAVAPLEPLAVQPGQAFPLWWGQITLVPAPAPRTFYPVQAA